MDFVDLCEQMLAEIYRRRLLDPNMSSIGVSAIDVGRAVLPTSVTSTSSWDTSPMMSTVRFALGDMATQDYVTPARSSFHAITQAGRAHHQDPLPDWREHCSRNLDEYQADVLRAVNRASITQTAEGAFVLSLVNQERVMAELGWPHERLPELSAAVGELLSLDMIAGFRGGSYSIQVRSTYLGAVWDMRQGETLEAEFLDGLLVDGETTSVDFKRELHLVPADQTAEFVKDVLALTNTQATGRRWLIIGIDDKTRKHYAPPGADIHQTRIEQCLEVYTSPQVQVRYSVVSYRGHMVGKLEMLRDKTLLPYRVRKSIGDKKRIEAGQVKVRHGSLTATATPEEEAALVAEGERARAFGIALH